MLAIDGGHFHQTAAPPLVLSDTARVDFLNWKELVDCKLPRQVLGLVRLSPVRAEVGDELLMPPELGG